MQIPLIRIPGHTQKLTASLAIMTIVLSGTAFAQALTQSKPTHFDWPVGMARVKETITKDGKAMTIAYTLNVTNTDDSKFLRVDYQDFEILSIAGRDSTDPQVQSAIASALPLMATQPSLKVAKSGELVDVVGVEAALERMNTLRRTFSKSTPTPEDDAAASKFMRSPQAQSLVRAKMSEVWYLWVQTWIDVSLPPGESEELSMQIPVGDRTVEVPLVRSNDGADPAHQGYIKLATESIFEGPDAVIALSALVDSLLKATSTQARERPRDSLVSMQRVVSTSVTTDPNTLKPAKSHSEQLVEMKTSDGKTHSMRESHQYEFHWLGETNIPQPSPTPAQPK